MGKKSAPPPAPDYTQAAEKTAASSQDAQTRADWANRPNQITPWGTQTWSSEAMTDPATGKPVTSWTQNTQLSGPQQQALDEQMAIQSGKSQIAGGMMGRLEESYQQPYDPSQLQAMGAVPQGDAAERPAHRGPVVRAHAARAPAADLGAGSATEEHGPVTRQRGMEPRVAAAG